MQPLPSRLAFGRWRLFVCLFACLLVRIRRAFVALLDRWCLWRTRRSRSKLSYSLSTDRVRAASFRTVPVRETVPVRAQHSACQLRRLLSTAGCALTPLWIRSQYAQRSTIPLRCRVAAGHRARHSLQRSAGLHGGSTGGSVGRCAGGDAHPRLDRAGRAHICEGPAADAVRCTVRRGECNLTCNITCIMQHATYNRTHTTRNICTMQHATLPHATLPHATLQHATGDSL